MKGFGHFVYAGVGYLIFINVLSIILLDITRIGFLIASIAVAIGAGWIQSIHARAEKKYNEGKKGMPTDEREKKRKRISLYKKLAIIDLTISAVILMAFHTGLIYNDLPYFNPVLILLGLFLSLLMGAVLPDLDFMLGIKFHRDPTTHSTLLAGFFATLCIFFLDDGLSPVNIMIAGITVGAAMHLFCDIIPEGSNGWQTIKALFQWSESPGDIRNIKEGREQLYLVLNGLILMFFSVFLALRALTGRLQFPSLLNAGIITLDPIAVSWFIACVLLLLSVSLMQVIFSSVKKTKKKTTKK